MKRLETIKSETREGLFVDNVFAAATAEMVGEPYDVVIIGAGPAGASAAIYAARAKMKTLVLDKAPGTGALALTNKIANYPGVRGEVTGQQLVDIMRRQAVDFGARFVQANVQGVYLAGETKEVFTPEAVFRGRSVIVATGATERGRKLPGEEQFLGRGVSYCATCDAAFYNQKHVAVLGDNEQALEEALFLTKFASLVHLVIPGKKLLGTEGNDDLPELSNLRYHFQHRPEGIVGGEEIEGVAVTGPDGRSDVIRAAGVFIFLSGGRPSTGFLMGALPLHENGHLVVAPDMSTPVEGVFAAGDVRKGPVKQVVLAAADGALAAIAADRHVNRRSKFIAQR